MMQMPKPQKGESKEDYMKRFMADKSMMMKFPDEKKRKEMGMKEWDKMEMKMMSSAMETVDLMGVPIFSTGVWEGKGSASGGDTITESVLDSWVKTFQEIGSKVKPRMRITHDESASKNILNAASLGWVTNLKREGKNLLADFKSVPKKIADLIGQKAFGRFSPGVYSSMSIDGNTYNNVLDHVALLGAELPANMDLDGFIDLYYESEITETGNLIYYENKINVQQESDMDSTITYEREYKSALSKLTEFEKKQEMLGKRIDELEKENLSLTGTIEQKEYERLESEAKNFFESAIKEGKISPAMLNEFMALCVDKGVKEYSFEGGKKKVSGTSLELVKSIIGNMPKVFNFQEESLNVDKLEDETDDITEKEMQEYSSKHKVSLKDAYKAIAKTKKKELNNG